MELRVPGHGEVELPCKIRIPLLQERSEIHTMGRRCEASPKVPVDARSRDVRPHWFTSCLKKSRVLLINVKSSYVSSLLEMRWHVTRFHYLLQIYRPCSTKALSKLCCYDDNEAFSNLSSHRSINIPSLHPRSCLSTVARLFFNLSLSDLSVFPFPDLKPISAYQLRQSGHKCHRCTFLPTYQPPQTATNSKTALSSCTSIYT